MSAAPVLEFRNVSRAFKVPGSRQVHLAVDCVSLEVRTGEVLALVGETGSGKSTLAKIGLQLIKQTEGDVLWFGRQTSALGAADLRRTRLKVQPVFQDPTASFNPRRRVGDTLEQALRAAGKSGPEVSAMSDELLNLIGLRPPRSYRDTYPHQLSGGQRQRLAIARAMATDPLVIIADEPLTGADVSIRGQLLNLFVDLQERLGVAYLFITHDIAVAKSFGQRVAIMQHGRIVEVGAAAKVLTHPDQLYTRQLLEAVHVP